MGFFFSLFLLQPGMRWVRACVHVSPKLSENMSIKMCVYRDANPATSSLAAWRFASSNVFRVSVCIINDDVSAKLSTTDPAHVVQICAS